MDLFRKFSLIFTKLITLPPSQELLSEQMLQIRSKKLEVLDNIYCRPYMKTGIPSLNIPKTDPMDIDRFAKTPLFCRNNHSHCTGY